MSVEGEGKLEAVVLFERHKLLLGGVTIAWNDCTQLVFELFVELSEMPFERASIVFFGIRNDRTQRQIVRELASIAGEKELGWLEDLEAALRNLDRTARVRNEAMHSAWAIQIAWSVNEHGLSTHREPPRLVKMKPGGDGDDGFTERFQKLENDLQGIGSKLIDVLRALRSPPAVSKSE